MPWMPLCNVHLLAVWNYWGIVVVLVFLVLGMIVNFIFWNRCRKCKRRMAIEKTGKTEKDSDREEWKCKYCGHHEWKKKRDYSTIGSGE